MLKTLGGDTNKLVIDLSCRRRGAHTWFVAMNKWQTITDMEVNEGKTTAPAARASTPRARANWLTALCLQNLSSSWNPTAASS